MTLLLSILYLLPLILSWQSEPHLTYTAQVSGDLREWDSLPYVIAGIEGEKSLAIPHDGYPVFARLRFSDTGDSNENGLPDLWEWQWFGRVDIDARDDPDGDGKNNHTEWLAGSDPLDFFDGELPVIRVPSGREWILPAGQPSAQALAVTVYHASGEPWAGAPVELRALEGLAGVLQGDPSAAGAVALLTGWTDPLGRLQPGLDAIRILSPAEPGARDTIRISAGRAAEDLVVRSTGPDFGQPPRQLALSPAGDGTSRLTWYGDPGQAVRFLVEEADVSGNWRPVLSLAALDLPAPEAGTGRFSLILD